jgi:putative heme-binding domain-containing protein
VVAHTAVKALVRLQAADASLAALDDPALPNDGAFRVLQELHDDAAVDALIAKLDENDLASDVRAGILSVLARLAVREGEWEGASWGTRPDTQGPYYLRADWAATDQIQATLQQAMEDERTDRSQLLAAMAINQLIDASYLPQVRALADADPSLEAAYVQALLMQEETPRDAFPLLERIAAGADRQGNLRVQAAQALARTGDPEAVRAAFPVIAVAGEGNAVEAYRQVIGAAREVLLATPIDRFGTDWLLEQTASDEPSVAMVAWGLLLQHAYAPDSPSAEQEQILAQVETAMSAPDTYEMVLQAVEEFQVWGAEEIVRAAYEHADADVREQAEETAEELQIDLSGEASDAPTLASMTPEAVIEAVTQVDGDVDLGEALFNRQTCTTCHTVDPAEPLKGPFLGNIASTFDRAELTMAILEPGATIAQGFVTHTITLEDGGSVTGFVTQEGAEEVVLRDVTGRVTTVAVEDIAERRTLPISMMPTGLAADMTVHDLASLLAYLEKLDEEL